MLNVDGQKFSVIIRLLKPDDKVRVNSKMDIVVSKKIYVGAVHPLLVVEKA